MNLGTDIATILSPTGVLDIAPDLRSIGGTDNLLWALTRRLVTPRGGLFYAEDYGTDVRGWLNSAWTPGRLAEAAFLVEGECEKDERVLSAGASVTFDQGTRTLSVAIALETTTGTLRFVLRFSALSVHVLRATP